MLLGLRERGGNGGAKSSEKGRTSIPESSQGTEGCEKEVSMKTWSIFIKWPAAGRERETSM